MAANLVTTYWRQFPGEEPQELPESSWRQYAEEAVKDVATAVEHGFQSRFGTRYWTVKEITAAK